MFLPLWLLLPALAPQCLASSSLSGLGLQCPFGPLACSPDQTICDGGREPPRPATQRGWIDHGMCLGKYCVYSNPGFLQGQGIAAVTAQANLPALRRLDRLAKHRAAEHRMSPDMHVAETPGKGLGFVADQKLERGDVAMVQPPVLLVQTAFMGVDEAHRDPLLDAAVAALPRETRDLFFSQMGHFGGGPVADRVWTDSFDAYLSGDDGQHYVNYPRVARFNHDCRPNVAYRIDEALNHRAVAARAVSPGEELTITYLNPLSPRAARQERAASAWGFNCTCAVCGGGSPEVAAASDRRLRRIDLLEQVLDDRELPASAETVRALLRQYREEKLDIKMFGALRVAAASANELGRAREARGYALEAVEAGLIERGETEAVEDMRALAEDPERHGTWRQRL